MDLTRIPDVLTLVSLIYVTTQIYLFFQLRNYLQRRIADPKWRRLLSGFVLFVFVLMLVPLAARGLFGGVANSYYSPLLRGLFSASTIWVVGSSGSCFALIVYNLFRWIILFFSRSRAATATVPDLQRRDFLQKAAGMAAAAPFVISGYGVVVERRRFEVDHFDIPIHGLSSALSQFTIVQLTDIHVGPFMPPEELAEYVEQVNRLQPDLVALTGDFVTSSRTEALPCAEALAELRARYGVFACLGNHDVYARAADMLTLHFGEKGIRTLRNDGTSIRIANSKIGVVGVDDLKRGKPDLGRALAMVQSDAPEVGLLLSHRPEIFPKAARAGLDLVLAGHYHGGQIKLGRGPESLSIARFLTPYAEGLFRLPRLNEDSKTKSKGATLFVSRGVGITGLPIRLNCSPQIAHLTLKKA
ncbi:MAG TPA: metallophosphoesterase [Candidatus Binatia bacterium]|nr:metallophosphoesterase [Candidatus Binatia bacterium]